MSSQVGQRDSIRFCRQRGGQNTESGRGQGLLPAFSPVLISPHQHHIALSLYLSAHELEPRLSSVMLHAAKLRILHPASSLFYPEAPELEGHAPFQ